MAPTMVHELEAAAGLVGGLRSTPEYAGVGRWVGEGRSRWKLWRLSIRNYATISTPRVSANDTMLFLTSSHGLVSDYKHDKLLCLFGRLYDAYASGQSYSTLQ
jgi:hypothetical protein